MPKPDRGGKRNSAGTGAGGGGPNPADIVTRVVVQSGDEVDLSQYPLEYGENDPAMSDEERKLVSDFEEQHRGRKSEYAQILDDQGKEIHTAKGGKNSCRLPMWAIMKAKILTHVHPRGKGEEGLLGGPFSDADMKIFAHNAGMQTIRASAEEGIYSMSKGADFDAKAFRSWFKAQDKAAQAQHSADVNQVYADYRAGKITLTEAQQGSKDAFNKWMISAHNTLLQGQSQFGYTYRLERWADNGKNS